jgi:tRNA dimethylallyltransferase
MSDRVRVGAVVGPTAVGKSEVALMIAQQLGAEIVSIDSMQLYRGMDVGTDKPTPEMRARVPHHLIDVKDPGEEVTVAEFQMMARDAIDEIAKRQKLPLLVGGSGLYFRAVVDDLRFPPTDPEIRLRLEEEAEAWGADTLHARLTQLDPAAAARIEPGNARRTVRALEVIEITGRPFSESDGWDRYESLYDLHAVGLNRKREDLFRRIEMRVEEMIRRGLIDEARGVAKGGMSRTARMALGYRQVLDKPEADESTLRDEIVRATKRFARRQDSWFRADQRIKWVDAETQEVTSVISAHLAEDENLERLADGELGSSRR